MCVGSLCTPIADGRRVRPEMAFPLLSLSSGFSLSLPPILRAIHLSLIHNNLLYYRYPTCLRLRIMRSPSPFPPLPRSPSPGEALPPSLLLLELRITNTNTPTHTLSLPLPASLVSLSLSPSSTPSISEAPADHWLDDLLGLDVSESFLNHLSDDIRASDIRITGKSALRQRSGVQPVPVPAPLPSLPLPSPPPLQTSSSSSHFH